MGPRSNDRGNGSIHRVPVPTGSASMGPRSNDRGNVVGSDSNGGCYSLQWGRDQMIAEMFWITSSFPGIQPASMGPRSNDRGNALSIEFVSEFFPASMGPRSNDRGNEAGYEASGEDLCGFNG